MGAPRNEVTAVFVVHVWATREGLAVQLRWRADAEDATTERVSRHDDVDDAVRVIADGVRAAARAFAHGP